VGTVRETRIKGAKPGLVYETPAWLDGLGARLRRLRGDQLGPGTASDRCYQVGAPLGPNLASFQSSASNLRRRYGRPRIALIAVMGQTPTTESSSPRRPTSLPRHRHPAWTLRIPSIRGERTYYKAIRAKDAATPSEGDGRAATEGSPHRPTRGITSDEAGPLVVDRWAKDRLENLPEAPVQFRLIGHKNQKVLAYREEAVRLWNREGSTRHQRHLTSSRRRWGSGPRTSRPRHPPLHRPGRKAREGSTRILSEGGVWANQPGSAPERA